MGECNLFSTGLLILTVIFGISAWIFFRKNIAPELPSQGNAIQEITTTLDEFQTNFFNTLDAISSNVEDQLTVKN